MNLSFFLKHILLDLLMTIAIAWQDEVERLSNYACTCKIFLAKYPCKIFLAKYSLQPVCVIRGFPIMSALAKTQ